MSLKSKSVVAPTLVVTAGFLAFYDVCNPSHPSQQTLSLFRSKPVFIGRSKLGEAKARLYVLPVLLVQITLDLEAEAWVRIH